MKQAPIYLTALVSLLALFFLQLLDFKFPLHRLRQRSFKCDTNNSTAFDSFGTPCFNISSTRDFTRFVYSYRSPQLSYLYCGIPKNGCTYHIAMMHRLMGYPYEGASNVHGPENVQRLKTTEEIHQMLQNDIRRYVIVRNPLYRVLSAYLNKVEVTYTDKSLKTPETFRKWVKENLRPDMDWTYVNPHWRPQVDFCGFKIRDLSKYFTLFRVEKPEEYVSYMEEFLPDEVLKDGWDVPSNKSFREHVLGPRSRTENTTKKFYDYIGDVETFGYLRQVYNEDIVMLGYEDEVDELRREIVAQFGKNR